MQTLPVGTVTFLFTDIEGSTKLWEQNPDAMRPALARHDALLRECIEQNGGCVFKTVGDAFCAAFPTANQALEAALAAQAALREELWETETPLLVRMALHTGSAEEREGDYFGQPLNRVARLMATAHGGQTLLSGATQAIVQDALPSGTSLVDLGRHRLKDLGQPEHVHQVSHPALAADCPPLRSLGNPALPNNLPQQTTSFIGREKQVEEVKAWLTKARLLTLTGAGGSGKTRLSLQVAADLLTGDGDGVWLVELAALSDPALVPQEVASVLGVKEAAGQPMQQTLVAALKPKRLLIVLDNCEHLVGACASLAADLLRNCPGVHLLASSREALNVSGEQTYRVPTLTLPDPKKPQTAESLSQFEAVRLFLDRAQAVQASFAVTDMNAPAVAQVCFRLDGIPLALELAAARVRSLPVEEINTRLDSRFRLLTGGSRTALPRQQTLRALVDWSYDLLGEREKTLLQRLSVFAGGWTLAAAEGVCSGNSVGEAGIDDWEVLDLLTGLADKSLVTYEEVDGRYGLLETVRQYAADRLQESGETEAVRSRSAAWFLTLAEEAEPQLAGPEAASWLGRLETEHDNLRAALAWNERSVDGTEASLRLAGALWRFWDVRGHLTEGRQWLRQTLAWTKPRTVGKDTTGAWAGSAAKAKALHASGTLARSQGDYAEAQALYRESWTIFRQMGDQNGTAGTLNRLGNVAYLQSDYTEARALYEKSLTISRQMGNQQGVATTLSNLGVVAHAQDDYAEAQSLYKEGLTIFRQMGNQQGIASTLFWLGNMAYLQSDCASAGALHEEALIIFRQLGDQNGMANTLNTLGLVASVQDDYRKARALHEEGLAIYRKMDDLYGISESLDGLAGVAQGQGEPEKAAELRAGANALRESIGRPRPPAEQAKMDKTMAAVREALGEDGFAAAWDAGRAMTWEQAVEYALSGE